MKTVTDQYFFAWKKLLELAIFRQNDEALGMAKLLGHCMNDRILALQLRADLYLFFDQIEKSKELYKHIIDLYAQSSSSDKANAIDEHMKCIMSEQHKK